VFKTMQVQTSANAKECRGRDGYPSVHLGATVSAVLSSESLGSRHRHPSWNRLVVVCWSDERQFGALADSSDSSSASGANR
jgi:hypothetical protein